MPPALSKDRELTVEGRRHRICPFSDLPGDLAARAERLPFVVRILLENVLRHVGRNDVTMDDAVRLAGWDPAAEAVTEVPFHPARVLMQDYTGIPTLVDLAAMRDAMAALGHDARIVNPQIPVDLVIDHSLIVDEAGHAGAAAINLEHEYRRNRERYHLAKWAERNFSGMRVVPPGRGILHQINIEAIAKVVRSEPGSDGAAFAFPDTMVGTDSHSTMVNGIGVLGWGVGGIEAEAAMLGLPLVVPLRRVHGVRLEGELREGVTATDLVLTLTERLRAVGVVDAFVEFFGPGLAGLAVVDRVTIANMAPEYGSSCAFFPVDQQTLAYLGGTGRPPEAVALVEAYARAQGLWRDASDPERLYSGVTAFDLCAVEPCAAGPRRPQDRVPLAAIADSFRAAMNVEAPGDRLPADGMRDGAVVIAAVTSCTNTSNPHVMVAAGLLARKAVAAGLRTKPWVKTSLTPGSRVVGAYLRDSGLQADLDRLGFQIAGYGCATCGGNSGRLAEAIEADIEARGIVAAAVLSGNRNFEARIHPLARANYLMSPPLVVAYALAGNVTVDLTTEPLGCGADGRPLFLRDIWPSSAEIEAVLAATVSPGLFRSKYERLFEGDPKWQALEAPPGSRFPWDAASTYIRRPPYFDGHEPEASAPQDVRGARCLVMLADSITTDHISPVGDISPTSPAGRFLQDRQVGPRDFNAYGSRRSNHEVMVRGTFANIRLRNELVPGHEGGVTRDLETGEILPIYDAAMAYAARGVPFVIVAGRDYGAGSSRDWAAKGTRLLGVRAVLAESFERIHRANLISMGVLPLQFPPGTDRRSLALTGSEWFDIPDLAARLAPGAEVPVFIRRTDGTVETVVMRSRIDTANESKVLAGGGILPFVLRRLSARAGAAPDIEKDVA
ncbi:aconitate hydratase AcnA [Labrys wisconsinensis]|uniref:Aconitate hydratase n=1 Tax=Labrys wisconsinensis TaxID=425677 RepID=A0ABU0JLS9_9HYPH|nr:aconitate hydratase AcnA [Labrys wisconsinensis]MDQ0475223.1 aconitate hydratase [Labrys wisconsinensis]